MFLLLFCLSAWAVASSAAIEKPYYDLEKAEQLFEQFISTYGKSYPHAAEKQRRLQIFRENIERINQLNSESGAVHAINQFTDITPDEFLATYTGFKKSARRTGEQGTCSVINDADIKTNDAPASWDWRDHNVVTEVKNQGPCGACWAFSCIGNIEGQYAKKHKKLISLSEQELLDCVTSSDSCDGGIMVLTMSELKTIAGVELEADYPYLEMRHECELNASRVQLKIIDCYRFNFTSEDKLKEALYKYGPLSIAIAVPDVWHTYSYENTIHNVRNCPNNPDGLNHGVLLVGYGTEGDVAYWILKNSWGAWWGDKGYIRITRGENTCALLNEETNTAVI